MYFPHQLDNELVILNSILNQYCVMERNKNQTTMILIIFSFFNVLNVFFLLLFDANILYIWKIWFFVFVSINISWDNVNHQYATFIESNFFLIVLIIYVKTSKNIQCYTHICYIFYMWYWYPFSANKYQIFTWVKLSLYRLNLK